MNREVMSRQMFRNGGAAFPDLSGDGQVTQKDILMGRGVIPMADGGVVEELAAIYATGDIDAFMDFFVKNERALRDEARRTRNPSLVTMINLIDKMEAADANQAIAETRRLAQMPSERMIEVARPGGSSYIPDPRPFPDETLQPGIPYEGLGTFFEEYRSSGPEPITDESGQVSKDMMKRLNKIFQSEYSGAPRLNEDEINNAYNMMISPKGFMDEEIREYATNPSGRMLDYTRRQAEYDFSKDPVGIQDFALGGVAAPAPMSAAQGPGGMPAMPDEAAMEGMPLEGVAQQVSQLGVNPADIEAMLGQIDPNLSNLENAENYEEVINGMREADAPIEVRYKELATFVGEEDANQTPESVLTLLQPVMMMAGGVDEGIGSLASDVMDTEVSGDMAGGIMSTVNMGTEEVPPVNFNQGGAVQYFAPENANRVAGAMPGGRLGQLYGEKRDLYRSIMGGGAQEEEYQKQKDLTQAQMLFDIAQGALAFAGGAGKPKASPAEQLAAAASPVLGNIGARAGELQKFKQAQAKEARAMDIAALTAAEGVLTAEKAAESAIELAKVKKAAEKINNTVFTNPNTGQTRRVDKNKTTEVENAIKAGFSVEGVLNKNSVVTLYDKNGDPYSFNLATQEGIKGYNKGLREGLSGKEPTNKIFGSGTLGMLKNILEGKGSSDLAKRYSLNQTNPDETNMIEGAINQYTNEIREYDSTSGKERIYPENRLIQPWVDALRKRSVIKGASMPTNIGPQEQARLNLSAYTDKKPEGGSEEFVSVIQGALSGQGDEDKATGQKKPRKEGTVPIEGPTYDSLTKEVAALGAMKNITGQLPAIKAFGNRFAEFVTGGPFFRDTAKAQNLLNNLNTTVTIGLMQAIPGKESEQLRQELKGVLPPVAAFTQGTEVALDKTEGFISYLNIQIEGLNRLIESPRPETKVGEINQNLEILKTYRDVYQNIAKQLEADQASSSAKELRPEIGTFFKGGKLPPVLQQGR